MKVITIFMLCSLSSVFTQDTSYVCSAKDSEMKCLANGISDKFEQLVSRINEISILVGHAPGIPQPRCDKDQSDKFGQLLRGINDISIKLDQNAITCPPRVDLNQGEKFDQLLGAINAISTKLVENQMSTPPSIDADLGEKLDRILSGINNLTARLGNNQITLKDQGVSENPCDAPIADENLPANCKDIYDSGERRSGIYTIYQPSSPSHQINKQFSVFCDTRTMISVYCDLAESTQGGPGWLLFQRRRDGSVNFARLWDDYKDGFGDLSGEFWLGNDNLALITAGEQQYELVIELGDWEGERRFARYSQVKILDETNKYKLELGSYSGDAGSDSIYYVRSAHFSTIDRDNDESNGQCAVMYQAGFWYPSCGYAFLNNPYHHSSACQAYKGIVWHLWHGSSYSLKSVEMKIRPIN